MLITLQVLLQPGICSGPDDIWYLHGKSFEPLLPLVIIYSSAIPVQHRLFSATIFIAVQMNRYSCFLERFEFIKKIEHTTVIGRVWHVVTNDMKLLFQSGQYLPVKVK